MTVMIRLPCGVCSSHQVEITHKFFIIQIAHTHSPVFFGEIFVLSQQHSAEEPLKSHDTTPVSHDIPSQDIGIQQRFCKDTASCNTGHPDGDGDSLSAPLDDGKQSISDDNVTTLVDKLVLTEVEGEKEEDDVNAHDDDSEGWITPANFQQVCEELGGAKEVCPEDLAVCCVTADYAIQVRN